MPTLPESPSVPLFYRLSSGALRFVLGAGPTLLAVAALYWALAPEMAWWRFAAATLATWYLLRSAVVDALTTQRR